MSDVMIPQTGLAMTAMAPSSVVIVGSLGHDGGSLTVALLQAGGMDVAGASPPFFELPQVGLNLRSFVEDFMPPGEQRLVTAAMKMLSFIRLAPGIDQEWFATLGGAAIKVVNAHLLSIPPGPHRAIMLDRNVGDRVTTMLRYLGQNDQPWCRDYFESYYRSRRPMARAVLERAGADVLDVDYEDLTGDAIRCRMAIDRIVDFIGRPLDRDAMVERVAEYERRQDDRVHRLRDDLPAAFKWLAPRGR